MTDRNRSAGNLFGKFRAALTVREAGEIFE